MVCQILKLEASEEFLLILGEHWEDVVLPDKISEQDGTSNGG
jgi:hypothetical protein